jgi:hypothetical protein
VLNDIKRSAICGLVAGGCSLQAARYVRCAINAFRRELKTATPVKLVAFEETCRLRSFLRMPEAMEVAFECNPPKLQARQGSVENYNRPFQNRSSSPLR